jgi:hypothetical protein
MFIIAGVSPKTKALESTPRLCPICGLARAYLKRIDHYFTLFFIPVIRLKKGQPVLICEKCEKNVPEMIPNVYSGSPAEDLCRFCGKTLKKEFNYCPYCGKPNT